MVSTPDLFKNRKVNFSKLESFGFIRQAAGYEYRCKLADTSFALTVFVTADGTVSTRLDDPDGGEYILHLVPEAVGSFVGRVRKEYNDFLNLLNTSCFEENVFKSEAAQNIIAYIEEKYGDKLEFLWQKLPEAAVVRRSDNRKWYVLFMSVSREKLKLSGQEMVEIIDVRAAPEKIAALVDGKTYFAGYHMNKKYWLTLCLNGSVPEDELYSLIDDSYQLAKK